MPLLAAWVSGVRCAVTARKKNHKEFQEAKLTLCLLCIKEADPGLIALDPLPCQLAVLAAKSYMRWMMTAISLRRMELTP